MPTDPTPTPHDGPPRPLGGRVAIITGATAGIGRATARLFADLGAKLVLNARRSDRLDALEAELDARLGVETAQPVPGDCARQDVIDRMLHLAADHFGKPADLVVVNAGRGLGGGLTTSDPDAWEEILRLNLLGAMRLMRSAARHMLDRVDADTWDRSPHDIVVLGSVVGRHVSPFSSVYGATKAALHSLTESVRRELGPRGVRVGLVEPGFVESEFQASAGYSADLVGDLHEKFGPALTPEDVAETIAWIASRPARVTIGDVVLRPTRQDYP